MSLIFEYRNLSSDTDLIDFTDRVDLSGGNVTVTENAEELTVGSSTITVDDPLGDWDIHGHAYVRIRETEAPNDLIWAGFTTIRHITRESYYGPGGRVWKMTLDDVNTVIARRIMTQDSANRPAETDVERIQWLFDESWLGASDAYFSTDDPVDMDASDCRGTTVADIVNDCLQQATGKNAFQQDTNDGSGGYIGFSFYGPNGSDIDVLTSDLRISNYQGDIDAQVGDLSGPGTAWTWGASDDTDLQRDPTRVYWKMIGQYDGGKVVRTRPETASHFAARETTASWPLVKSATKANDRADRQLEILSTEEDVITTTILVHAYHINDARPGARISCRFSHLPGYEDWSWMRILNRTVKLITPDVYAITYTLSAVATVEPPGIVQYKLGNGTGIEFDNPVTEGHTIVAFVFNRDSGTAPPDHVIDGISDPAVAFTTIAEVVKVASPSHAGRWAGMYYRVVTSVDNGLVKYTSAGSSQTIGLLEITGTYAGVFGAQDTTDIGFFTDCGGDVTPPDGASLVIGMAAIGHSDNPGTIPGPVDSDAGITDLENYWGGGSPYIYIAYLPVVDASGSYSIGGALTGSMLDFSWVFCGVTGVFV